MSDNDGSRLARTSSTATTTAFELAGDLLPARRGRAASGAGRRCTAAAGALGARHRCTYWGPYLAARGYRLFHDQLSPGRQGRRRPIRRRCTTWCAAVQFVRGEAKALNIDPERIALMGASAGAHLSALVGACHAIRPFPRRLSGRQARRRRAPRSRRVVGVFGVYDMAANWVRFPSARRRATTRPTFSSACTPMEDRKLYFEASPISYATFANNKVAVFLSGAPRTISSIPPAVRGRSCWR